MSALDREGLVERMGLALCHDDCEQADWPKPEMAVFRGTQGYRNYIRRARAALAIAEPAVREDEREACAAAADFEADVWMEKARECVPAVIEDAFKKYATGARTAAASIRVRKEPRA